MSLQQGKEPLAPRSRVFALQAHAKEQKQRPKKANPNSNGKEIKYSHNYQRLMQLGRKRTWDAAGINEYPARGPLANSSKGAASAPQGIAHQQGECQLSTSMAVRQWISETSALVHTPSPPTDETSSGPPAGMPTHTSKSFSTALVTSKGSGRVGSQVFSARASTISEPNTQSIIETSVSLSSPRSLSGISVTPVASTISGASSQSDHEAVSPVPRTSTSQISATSSESSFCSRSQNDDVSPAAPTSSRHVSTELRYDLRGRENRRPMRVGEAGPRLSATDIQKLLIIPKGLVTQKEYGKPKTGARIVTPSLKARNRGGKLANKTKPKMTVTELQKQFILPRGLVTQKQYGKKAEAPMANLYAKGSYAGRLVELMHYHRSEYSMWINAGIREPLAVIEILSLSRAMGLQWTKCKTIFSNKVNPFFAYGVTKTRSSPQSHGNAGGDDITGKMPLREFGVRERATWGGRGALSDQDGPLNSHDKPTPFSGPLFESGMGSEIEHTEGMLTKERESGKEWRIVYEQFTDLDQARAQGRPSLSYKSMQVSKSSDSFEEQGQEYSSGGTSTGSQGLLSSFLDKPVNVLHFKGSLVSDGIAPSKIALVDRDQRYYDATSKGIGINETDDQNLELARMKDNRPASIEAQTDKVLGRAVSEVSCVDDISSDSGELPVLVPLSSLQNSFERLQQESMPLSIVTDTELGSTFDIVFSSMFNHLTLKVGDRVEIHEPCRPVTLFEDAPREGSDPEACVWVVDRYIVE